MSRLVVKKTGPGPDGNTIRITPASAGWKYVGFEAYTLRSGQSLSRTTEGNEVCLVVLTGRVTVVSGPDRWENIGERMSVFEGKRPYAVLLPPGREWTVEPLTDAEVAVCSAPAEKKTPARLITPGQMSVEHRGAGNMTRVVHNILPENEPAESLLVVEVFVNDGCWSGYPPHKHDESNLPVESYLEETYYHKLNPADGFALMSAYKSDGTMDEGIVVRDGNAVLVPCGFHPLVAPPGHKVYFINVMAGPVRTWRFFIDPVCLAAVGGGK
ncbi:MAG: 5-deoxy-glucuronate isomerase [Verrucomicrobiae bacterium]|nr:5-deoxy-glucuronate isomerase [Verrucomicrobiae bacterium]